MKTTYCLLLAAALLAANTALSNEIPSPAKTSPSLNGTLSAGWASRYISEGMDCLPGQGIYIVNPTVSISNFTLNAWYAAGDTNKYNELDLVLSYTWQVTEKLTLTPWYEQQLYLDTNDSISNPALTATYALTDWLNIGGDMQWKAEHNRMNGYYDLFLSATWNPMEQLTITPKVLVGWNSGYLYDVGEGMNTIDWSLSAAWQFHENLALTASVNYSQALSVLRRADLGDDFWVGAGITFSF